MENDNVNPEQPQSEAEMVQQFAQSTVETWSMTLVAYKRRIESLDSRVNQLEQAKQTQQVLLDSHEARIIYLESLLRGHTLSMSKLPITPFSGNFGTSLVRQADYTDM